MVEGGAPTEGEERGTTTQKEEESRWSRYEWWCLPSSSSTFGQVLLIGTRWSQILRGPFDGE